MSDTFVILDGRARFLAERGHNFTSQFGEDGLVRALFEKIGVANHFCFEVGAADGLFLSNTKQWRDEGWECVLIEAGDDHFEKLKAQETERVHVVHRRIGPDSLDGILSACSAPLNLDFGVIDIDGQDYWVWRGMEKFQPRVMLVEFSPYGTPDDLPELGGPGQAGLNPIIALGKEKGYVALAHTYVNVLFVQSELALSLEAI